ncbi:hypothetical protein [Paenibacillus faecis]|uniref:hypothetical protein n=1 Tax=Paenibacillus faecis TaxID=862114 RepID=UPI001BCF7029|nr:hypothetical protein [Paenibacillus faecis]
MSNLALWCEIEVIWGPILEKVRQKPDFWARTRGIGPFLAAILPEKANLGEIAAQIATIITDGQKKLRTRSTKSGLMQRQRPTAGNKTFFDRYFLGRGESGRNNGPKGRYCSDSEQVKRILFTLLTRN